jgi:hypothetical protein
MKKFLSIGLADAVVTICYIFLHFEEMTPNYSRGFPKLALKLSFLYKLSRRRIFPIPATFVSVNRFFMNCE